MKSDLVISRRERRDTVAVSRSSIMSESSSSFQVRNLPLVEGSVQECS